MMLQPSTRYFRHRIATSSFCHPRHTPRVVGGVLVVLIGILTGPVRAEEEDTQTPIDFQRQIQPILADNCAHCHGRDEATRHGGLRLDVRELALEGGDSGEPAIVPGDPEASLLIQRVMSEEEWEVMPPADENHPLNPAQKELLAEWIRQGAPYAEHWAFEAPRQVELPLEGPDHPVDALVTARLKTRSLSLSPRADSSTLARRLYLDLIGLPPSPEEVKAFEQDGLEATVDRLLASERYGEKWAMYWLDAARYSDTNGYEKDMPRDQWIWRDWVIRALNEDMPYDRFVIEQIAGDLLPDAGQEQMVATGFLRNSMLNEEGAIIPEEFRMFEMFDRMDCVGKAVLGLSLQCAQCHSHKFDPVSHNEYFGLFAFLNNSYEAQSWVYTDDQQQQVSEVHKSVREVEERLRSEVSDWEERFASWVENLRRQQIEWTMLDAVELGSVSGLTHPVQLEDRSLLMRGHVSGDIFMVASPEMEGVTGLRLEALNHGDMPHRGPGRSSTGTFGVSALEVHIQKPDSDQWEKLELTEPTADFSQPDVQDDDGKRATGPVKYILDGKGETTWRVDRGIGRRNQPSVAVVQFTEPLSLPEGTKMKVALRMTDMLGCCRLSITTAPDPRALPVDYAAPLALGRPEVYGHDSQAIQEALFTAWYRAEPDLAAYRDEINAHWERLPNALTTVLHLAEREPEQKRETYLLDRGEWNMPKHAVEPHTPEALHPLETDEETPPRLALARWLVDPRAPLTARVAVNRVWQGLFGEGLVETPEDFGTRAPVPEYGEVLDWLAVDFMENGWSQKELIRRIVTSETYQQTSSAPAELLEQDPKNRWLARGPRYRVDAELVRDMALSLSGLITHQVGGPGIIPPVPQNVLDYNYVYPSYWKAAEGPERYRRSIYLFRKRSMPNPVMSSFDAPSADFSCVQRVRSNTPLAALAGLNEIVFVEAARGLALRVLREGGTTDVERAEYAFQLCTCRQPTSEEVDEMVRFLETQRMRLAEGWLDIREVATGDATQLPDLPETATPQDAAAWTLLARVLINLDETVTKN
jgi:mono/diheme cytochrome c family protein